MKKIYLYTDYKALLSDFYVAAKTSSRGLTYARFSELAGLNSPNYLKLVMDGKRRLTPATIQSFASAMRIEGVELEFFEALVLENQAETVKERDYYGRRLKGIKGSLKVHSVFRKVPGRDISDGLRSAIKLCSEGKTWDEALELGVTELLLTPEVASDYLESLVESSELFMSSKGTFSLGQKHTMLNDPRSLSLGQRLYLQRGLDEAQTIFLERYNKGTAKFLSLLFTASPGGLPAIFADLRVAFEDIARKYDPSSREETAVYRIQFQAYRFKCNET